MAADLEKLVVQLTTDFRDFQKGMAQTAGITNREFRKVEDRARQMNRNLDRIGRSSARSLVAPFMGISAALGGRELIRMTGVWTDLNSRLANAVGPQQASTSMDRLSEMARRTYSSLEQTTEGFLSFSTTLTELGYSTGQQLDFVESLNNALVVSGARGDVAARVMEALSRAMALGTLSGENLNTVIASGGRVAQALAESMGVTTLELRRLGQEGRIGRREMMGITTQLGQLREEAGRMPGTIQDGFLLLNNALLEYIGRGDDAVGMSARIAEALTMIADNFDTVADAGLQVAAVIAGALVGRSLLGLIRTAGQGTTALVVLTRALTQARTASMALAAFGGVGVAAPAVAMVLGGALVYSLIRFRAHSEDATDAGRWLSRTLDEIRAAGEGAAEGVDAAAQAVSQSQLNAARQREELAARRYAAAVDDVSRALRGEADRLQAVLDVVQSGRGQRFELLFSPEDLANIRDWIEELERGDKTVEDVREEIARLANTNPNFQSIMDALDGPIARALELFQALSLARTEYERLGAIEAGESFFGRRVGQIRGAANQQTQVAAFLAEQERLASRTREQIDLERELESVRADAARQGVTLTQQQIEERARANLAAREAANPSRRGGGGGRGRRDQYTREVEQFRQQIAALEAEARAIDGVGLSLSGYADAAEYAQRRLELMRAAQEQGLTITPQLQAEIDALAQSYIDAGNAVDQARERHEQFARAVEDVRGTMEQAFTGLITGAHSFKDALRMVIARLAEMAASRAFQQLWDGAGGVGSGKGFGGAVGGFLRRLMGFSDGGPTPPGGKHQPVGIVHAGENVWSQEDVRRAGGMAVVEALRRSGGRAPGFATGGHLGALVPASPRQLQRADAQVIYVPQPYIAQVSADDNGKMVATMHRVAQVEVRRAGPGIAASAAQMTRHAMAKTKFGGGF